MESELEKTVVLDTASTTLPTLESKRRANAILGELTPTGELNLREARLIQVPRELLEEKWDRVLHLDLRENEISTIDCSPILGLQQLRTLDLRCNRLEILPEEINTLQRLKVLRLDENLISFLPRSLWTMTGLEALTLGKNSLFSIPGEIAALKKLKTLVFCDNRILSLPTEMGLLVNLLALSIHGNEFSSLPTSLHSLTQLKELSLEWFRYACPPLPRVLKGNIGQRMIESLCELCLQLHKNKVLNCTLLMFLLHFSEEEAQEIQLPNKSKKSSLHLAAQEGDCGVIKGLLESGIGINMLDADGFSPFCLALREDRLSCAKLLMEKETDVKIGGGHFGTPLHLAVLKQEPWLVRDLIKRGAVINARDKEGNTPLHLAMAAFSQSPRKGLLIADMLLNAGAGINIENCDRATPLHLAVKSGQIEAVKWILLANRKLDHLKKERFNVNAKGRGGVTPLHLATHAGMYDIARLLVEVGRAKVFVKTNDGLTPKQISKKDLALIKYLIQAERDEIRENNMKRQKVQVVDQEPSEKLPQAEEVLDESRSFSERYSAMYSLFALQRIEELRSLASSMDPSCPLLPDLIYLVGQLNDGRALPFLEKMSTDNTTQSSLLREETLNSVDRIRGASTQTLAMRVIMGPKLQKSEQVLRGCFSVRAFATFSKDDRTKRNQQM